MNKSKEQLEYQELAAKWLDRTITADEELKFAKWYNEGQEEALEVPATFASDEETHKSRIFNKVQSQINLKKTIRIWPGLVAASLLIGACLTGFFFYWQNQSEGPELAVNALENNDVLPGGNKAVLTLANGKVLSLSDLKNGQLAQQMGVVITKRKDGQLVYKAVANDKKGSNVGYNIISTPRGGQYEINLSDGTRVWLNAASSLKFPTTFSKSDRKVVLSGEGYFQVAKDKRRPFKVESDQQTVTVYGTHFNINAYNDDKSRVTTLIEGSVDVNGVFLKPNQQSIITDQKVNVVSADIEKVMAWKNGYFRFDEAPLEDIMKKISRWYDVDVEFVDPELKTLEFGVVANRFANVSKVLKMLELTHEISFIVKDRKIIVMNKQKSGAKK
ncbi:FecR family protein [Pedobacter nyackensis]|uniref:FecR family protein n=1 Tax=Pedobacter nyackensis TaxID=475255 RepID=UPI00292F6252|nr:FecR domain-containing protein [Pedobacter nyackensis]